MYIPAHNEESDIAVLHDLIRSRPLGAWVTLGEDGLAGTHIPFLIDPVRGEFGTLIGHVARANPVWKSLSASVPSLVIFQGPQAYISPSWYPSKQVNSKTVPTWNYAVVHAHGVALVIEDADWLLRHVMQLTDRHEVGQARPWKVSDAPREFVEQMLRAIVGIEIPIDRLTGKWKVSQNRSDEDKRGVAAGLSAACDDESAAMSALVERYRCAQR